MEGLLEFGFVGDVFDFEFPGSFGELVPIVLSADAIDEIDMAGPGIESESVGAIVPGIEVFEDDGFAFEDTFFTSSLLEGIVGVWFVGGFVEFDEIFSGDEFAAGRFGAEELSAGSGFFGDRDGLGQGGWIVGFGEGEFAADGGVVIEQEGDVGAIAEGAGVISLVVLAGS